MLLLCACTYDSLCYPCIVIMQKSILTEPRMGVRIGGLGCPWSLLARADMHERSLGRSIEWDWTTEKDGRQEDIWAVQKKCLFFAKPLEMFQSWWEVSHRPCEALAALVGPQVTKCSANIRRSCSPHHRPEPVSFWHPEASRSGEHSWHPALPCMVAQVVTHTWAPGEGLKSTQSKEDLLCWNSYDFPRKGTVISGCVKGPLCSCENTGHGRERSRSGYGVGVKCWLNWWSGSWF